MRPDTCLSSMDCQSQTRSQFYKIVTNCKYSDCSVHTLYLPSLIELWDLAAILHGNTLLSRQGLGFMRFLLLQTVSPTIVQNTHYIYHLCIRAVGQFYQTTNRLSQSSTW